MQLLADGRVHSRLLKAVGRVVCWVSSEELECETAGRVIVAADVFVVVVVVSSVVGDSV